MTSLWDEQIVTAASAGAKKRRTVTRHAEAALYVIMYDVSLELSCIIASCQRMLGRVHTFREARDA